MRKWQLPEETASTKTGGQNEHVTFGDLEKIQYGQNIKWGMKGGAKEVGQGQIMSKTLSLPLSMLQDFYRI